MDRNTLESYSQLDRLLELLMQRYHNINTCQY